MVDSARVVAVAAEVEQEAEDVRVVRDRVKEREPLRANGAAADGGRCRRNARRACDGGEGEPDRRRYGYAAKEPEMLVRRKRIEQRAEGEKERGPASAHARRRSR